MEDLLADFLGAKGFALTLILEDGTIKNHVQMDDLTEIEKVGFVDCAYNLAEIVTDIHKESKEVF